MFGTIELVSESIELMFGSIEHRFICGLTGKTHQTFYLLTDRY